MTGKPPGWISARTIDEGEVVASVLLAILVVHWLGAANVHWAAFAGYMVMRGHAAETMLRGVLRIIGTIAGGGLAWLVAPALAGNPWLAAAALFVVASLSLYAAITAKRSYAWLFFGLSFAMVALDQIEHPETAVRAFVETRVLETVAGTLACVAISLASTLTLRRIWPAERAPAAQGLGWRPDAFRHAMQGGIAVALLVALQAWLKVPALAQSAVSIMAVMLVPATGLARGGFGPVSRRNLYRFIGCLAGGALAALFLFAAQGGAALLLIGTAIGVVIGRHLENGDHPHRYVGTQFALAVLVTLVPDSYADAAIAPGLERLTAILIGMAVLEPVLLASHWLAPRRIVAAEAAQRDEVGGV